MLYHIFSTSLGSLKNREPGNSCSKNQQLFPGGWDGKDKMKYINYISVQIWYCKYQFGAIMSIYYPFRKSSQPFSHLANTLAATLQECYE